MRALSIIGIVLIVVGAAALVMKGIRYTTHETVVDAGPVRVEAERKKTIPIGPVTGGITLVAGLVLVAVGRRQA